MIMIVSQYQEKSRQSSPHDRFVAAISKTKTIDRRQIIKLYVAVSHLAARCGVRSMLGYPNTRH